MLLNVLRNYIPKYNSLKILINNLYFTFISILKFNLPCHKISRLLRSLIEHHGIYNLFTVLPSCYF